MVSYIANYWIIKWLAICVKCYIIMGDILNLVANIALQSYNYLVTSNTVRLIVHLVNLSLAMIVCTFNVLYS